MTAPGGRPNRRTRGITAIIEGFFALMWFSWGGADASSGLTVALAVGSVLAVLVTVAGARLAVRSPGQASPMRDPAVRRRYNTIVVAEFGLLGIGAAILGAAGLADWIAVWVCAGVGVHFLPLAGVFGDRLLVPLGVLIVAVAAAALVVGLTTTTAPAALVVGLTTTTAPGTVTGPATGVALLTAAVATLSGWPRPAAEPEPERVGPDRVRQA